MRTHICGTERIVFTPEDRLLASESTIEPETIEERESAECSME